MISFTLVSIILVTAIFIFNNEQRERRATKNQQVEKWLNLGYLDFDRPQHYAILEESLNIFEPSAQKDHKELISQIRDYRQMQILDAKNADIRNPLNWQKVKNLLWMYAKFIFVYLVTLLLTWYGVQTLGVYRFIRFKQNRKSYFHEMIIYISNIKNSKDWHMMLKAYLPIFGYLAKTILKGAAYLVLFSPAYVLAYSFRTGFDTDILIFMILLGVISNAILVTYTHKFYTFLVSESRKGYIDTAIVKNMNNSFRRNGKTGISLKHIFEWNKEFSGHIMSPIYENARYQYLATIKEQASFLITGLIIIEMALNIQGHLSYGLLQNILYENYAVVATIILGIFLVVKTTEVSVDFLIAKETAQYSNK